jgi:hypothetical protein
MMKEVTIIKNNRGAESLRPTELRVLTETIRSGEYQKEVNNLQSYEKARLVYNGQLGVTIEKLEPLDRVC